MVRSKIAGFLYLLALILILVSFLGVAPLAFEYWGELILGGFWLVMSIYFAFREREARLYPCGDCSNPSVERLGASGLGLLACSFIIGTAALTAWVRDSVISDFPHSNWARMLSFVPELVSISYWLIAALLSFIGALVYDKSKGVIYPPDAKQQRKVTKRRRKPTRKPRRWVPSKRQVIVAVCPSCGSGNNPAGKACWHCGHSIQTAPQHTEQIETAQHYVVCSGVILTKDRVVLCPSCRTQGHRAHLLEYVRVQAVCPTCGQRLRAAHLIPTS